MKQRKHPKTHPFFNDAADALPDLPSEPALTTQGFGGTNSGRRTWKRPRSGETEQRFQYYCPESLARRIRAFCGERDCSYSHFFAVAATEYLAKQKRK
jgi:hypothetical protein